MTKPSLTTPQDRLAHAISALGTNPSQVAERFGCSRQNIHAILAGRKLNDAFAATFQSYYGVNQRWLLTGEGEMWADSGKGRPGTEELSELPLLDRLAVVLPDRDAGWSGEVFKLGPKLCRPSMPGAFRYVLRTEERALAPHILPGDRLLMEGRLDLDVEKEESRRYVEGRLCGVLYEGQPLLRWVTFAEHPQRPWPVLKTASEEVRVSRRKEANFKVVAVCIGLVWRAIGAPRLAEG